MGLDDYETPEETQVGIARGIPPLGIGKNTHIERAIVDKNARIGDNVHLSPEGKPEHFDGDGYYIRDGIVVVPKGGIIAAAPNFKVAVALRATVPFLGLPGASLPSFPSCTCERTCRGNFVASLHPNFVNLAQIPLIRQKIRRRS